MKILFLMSSFYGVTEAYRLDQIIALLERGEDVRILAMKKPKNQVSEDLSGYDILARTTYLDVNSSRLNKLKLLILWMLLAIATRPVRTVKGLMMILNQRLDVIYAIIFCFAIRGRYDVMHAHFGQAGVTVYPIRDILGIPIVVSFYGWDFSHDLNARPWEYRKMFDVVDRITAMTEFMEEKLIASGCPTDKIEVVRIWAKDSFVVKESYVDESVFNNRKVNILSIGRMTEKKGYDICFRAIRQLILMKSNIHYHVIGEGPLDIELKNLCRELDLDGRVTFWGSMSRDEVKRYIEACDIFLLHSITASDGDMEGTPTVVLEAGLLEKPVVSTFHSGIPEIIQHEYSGLLTEERDVKQTVHYINLLIENRKLRISYGKALRQKILKDYSKDEHSSRYINLYSSLSGRTKSLC